jgi:OOP family OmpA-OmpF porin
MPAWKEEPPLAKGALIAGVLRDGDWNIAMKWASMNNIPNNPDEKTYDPNALNWVNADTYTKAAEMYVSGYCEDRTLKTELTQKKHVCVNGVVTWTPGDVTVAKKRGGLVPLLTTRESAFQMPSVMIGIHKWNQAHRPAVVNILQSSFQAADQIRSNPEALEKAAELSYEVYKEESPAYWLKFYRGTTEADAQGIKVPLGGSTVANLADNLQLFGLAGNSGNIMKADYETFGNLVVQQYPNVVPRYPKIQDVLDTSYVQAVQSKGPSTPAESTEQYTASAPMKEIVGRRNYSIQFRTGSAEILPGSFSVLNQIYSDVLMTNMVVAVHGFTDNTGTPDGNMILSKQRAESVKHYLESKASGSFPEGRVRVFAHGQDDPVASNATEGGRAQNRRVQIVMGTIQ